MKTPKVRKGLKIFLFLLPVLVFALAFVYYPFCRIIINAFSKVNAKGTVKIFVGWDNFRYVLGRKDFFPTLRHTLVLAAVDVPITLVITLTLAFLAEKKRFLSPLYETLFTLPMSVSMASACMIFKAMLSPTVGFVNAFLGLKYSWFESKETALSACLTLTVWMGIGFDFMLLLAALRSIPRSIIEAADVDGIRPLRRILRIQIPLISPTIFYIACNNLILALMTSAPMIIILGSAPEASAASTLMSMMYQSGLAGSDYSLAAVLSIITFLLVLTFTILAFRFEGEKVHYQ